MTTRNVVLLLLACVPAWATAENRPNVLFIAVDDLNDWVGVFGGHAQGKTPNLDSFARRGSVVFQNAHCPGPVCGPSRSALLSGFMPHRTGVYGNSRNMLNSQLVQQHATLPEYFAKHGYETISRGKIFHRHATAGGIDSGHWAFERWEHKSGGTPVNKSRLTSRDKNLIDGTPGPPSKNTKAGGSEFAWGPTVGGFKETSDYKTAAWAAEQLAAKHDKPFLLAVGLSKPHLPFYSPQEFFDMHPLENVKANPILSDDLADILTPAGKPKYRPTADFLWIKENELFEEVTQAYLACVSYADACVGVILDGLRNSNYADNTIVIIWGDHGWHLGEKLRYRKATPWSEATRLPLIIRTPSMNELTKCDRPVNLIDLFPTLIDYCELPAKPEIDGDSLVPLLKDPDAKWRDATVTIFGSGDASVVGLQWRYIQHRDGTEELYYLEEDPLEWNNMIRSPNSAPRRAKQRLRKFVPKHFAPPIPKSDPSLKKKAQGIDRALKATRDLEALK